MTSKITIDTSSRRLLIVDNGYYNFYRFHATLSWYKRSADRQKESEGISWLNNKTFMQTFEKMWFATIKNMCKKFGVQFRDIIFARDGHHVWRYEIFPEYKAHRIMLSEKNDIHSPCPLFRHVHQNYYRRLPEIKVLMSNRAEADDIIAVITKYIRKKYPMKKIIIITGDNDFLQLSEPGMVELYQLKGFLRFTSFYPQVALFTKILSGDPSDNIPPAFKGCGKITAKKLAEDRDKLEQILDHKGKEQFELNRQLIDFDYIPQDVVKEIESLIS